MTESADDRKNRLLETICEMCDAERLLDLFDAEYQRGRDDYRDELLARMDAKFVTSGAATVKHGDVVFRSDGSPSGVVVPTRNPPMPSTPKRPEGIPSTSEMIQTVLREKPGIKIAEIAAVMAERWWPGVRVTDLSTYVSDGIKKDLWFRDVDGRLNLSPKVSRDQNETGEEYEQRTGKQVAVTPASIKPTEDIRPIEASKNVGGRPSTSFRPEGIPTNLAMAIEAIRSLDGKASAPQIRDWIRKKYWSGLPDHWTAVLYDMVKTEKLKRDGINFTVAPPKAMVPTKPIAPPAPVRRGPSPEVAVAEFKHNGGVVQLISREYMMATKLLAVKGQHIDVGFLADSIGVQKGSAVDREGILRDCQSSVNEKIGQLGLTIEFFKGFGFLMKDKS